MRLHRALDLFSFRQNRRRNSFVLAQHQRDGVAERQPIELHRNWIPLLGRRERESKVQSPMSNVVLLAAFDSRRFDRL
jgi:hypothetical protein